MVETTDIYKAINNGAPWVTIQYLMEQLEARGIFIRRSEWRELWADKNGVSMAPRRYQKIFTPVVGPDENVIDTRTEPQCNSGHGSIFDCPVHGEAAQRFLTQAWKVSVAETSDYLPEAPEVKRIPDLGWLGTGVTSFGLKAAREQEAKTTRQVMRESEDGPICGDRSDSY